MIELQLHLRCRKLAFPTLSVKEFRKLLRTSSAPAAIQSRSRFVKWPQPFSERVRVRLHRALPFVDGRRVAKLIPFRQVGEGANSESRPAPHHRPVPSAEKRFVIRKGVSISDLIFSPECR